MTAKAKLREAPALSDQELWRRLTSGVKPLKHRKARAPAAAAGPRAAERPKAEKAKKIAKPEKAARAPTPAAPGLPELPPPALGKRAPVPGLDKRTAERLRKGEMAIEARLDLHGLNQAEAASALSRFVRQSRLSGLRCLLVITGKGGRRGEDGAESAGVLKQLVPRWLGAGAERAHILAIATARPQHGGAGALYVLLKRPERG